MRNALVFLMGFLMTGPLWADDLTLAAQQRLKDQGFYYGAVDGQGGEETSAAIRRYQIRTGLRVTGQLNGETTRSLGLSRANAARPAPEYRQNAEPTGGQPDDQYERPSPRQNGGQEFPPPDPPEDYREMRPPSVAPPRMVTSLPRLFAGTIYERASAQIQVNVLYAVQGELMRRGFFRGIIDGQTGPATSDALIRLQVYEGLPVSGRLDNETLDDLGAFPGQRNGPPEGGLRERPDGRLFNRDVPESY